jgi:hypothetical protein
MSGSIDITKLRERFRLKPPEKKDTKLSVA